MTVVSTPAWSSDIAQLCRRACECSCLPCRDGQLVVAAAAWVLTRCSIASRLSRLPVRVANSGSAGRPARSASQLASIACARGERDGALFSPFGVAAADVRAGPERDVAAVQGDQFGDSEAGVDRECEDRAVAAA